MTPPAYGGRCPLLADPLPIADQVVTVLLSVRNRFLISNRPRTRLGWGGPVRAWHLGQLMGNPMGDWFAIDRKLVCVGETVKGPMSDPRFSGAAAGDGTVHYLATHYLVTLYEAIGED
jgi:hypothetical protein